MAKNFDIPFIADLALREKQIHGWLDSGFRRNDELGILTDFCYKGAIRWV